METIAKLRFGMTLVLAVGLQGANAQEYPNQPIKIIVPYAAGGSDYQIRAMLPALTKELGGNASFVVENQGAAGGQVAVSTVAGAPANGYTLLFSGGGPVLIVPLMRKVNYKLENLAPIANITSTPLLVVARVNVPYTTVQEFLAYAKKNPGAVNYSSSGIGTTPHIVAEAFQAAADIKMTHVPFQGIGLAITAMLSGTVDMYIGIPGSLLPHVQEGKLRVLASTGTARSEFAPQVPTLRELGFDVVEATRFALFAPRQTPDVVLNKLSTAVRTAANSPEFIASMRKMSTTVAYSNPSETQNIFAQDSKAYQLTLTRTGLMNQDPK
jgi:tripartite-type tricarboxylate transporter receptor subunit TctC